MTIPEIKDKELHRIVTTTLIYNPDHKYLITKRSLAKKVHPGKWTIPGGGLNVDDYINSPKASSGNRWINPLEVSLLREIKEEAGVIIGEPRLLNNFTFIRPDGIPVLCFNFYAPYISGEVILDDDATDFAWVSLEEAEKYDLIEGILDDLKEVDRILNSR